MNLQNIHENQKIQFKKKSLQLNQLENNNKEPLKSDEKFMHNYTLNNSDNHDYYSLKLFPQNIDDSTIMKKLNDIKDETIIKQFKTDNFGIKNEIEKDKNKINDYEKKLNNSWKKDNDILTLSEYNSTVIRDLNESNDEICKLRRENIQLKQNINRLKNQFSKMKSDYLITEKEEYLQIENTIPKLNNIENTKLNIYDKEKIITLNNEKEISSKVIDNEEINSQKDELIQRLNDCICEYNNTIIESKNEIFERDEEIKQLVTEKTELIEQNNKFLNQLIQNKNDLDKLNSKIKELINENEKKDSKINSLSIIISNLQNEKNIIKLSSQQDSNKINSLVNSYKQHQIEVNNQILLLTKNNSEKDKIINNLNQNILIYKSKLQENQNKISNFYKILIEMKKYVFEVEKMISNTKEKKLPMFKIPISEMKKNINEDSNNRKIDNLDINTSEYTYYLLNSLKNMILNIDSKIN